MNDLVKYRTLFDMAADCLMVLDELGKIVEINESGCHQRGYTKQEMLGRHVSEFDPPEFAALVKGRIQALFRNGVALFESAHVCKDGHIMPVEIHCRVIEFQGKPHVFSVVRDITEQKKLREEIEESRRTLKEQANFLIGVSSRSR